MMMMVEGRLAREVGSFLEFGEEVDKEGTSVCVCVCLFMCVCVCVYLCV